MCQSKTTVDKTPHAPRPETSHDNEPAGLIRIYHGQLYISYHVIDWSGSVV